MPFVFLSLFEHTCSVSKKKNFFHSTQDKNEMLLDFQGTSRVIESKE